MNTRPGLRARIGLLAALALSAPAVALVAAPGEAATPVPSGGGTQVVSVDDTNTTFGGGFPKLSGNGRYVFYTDQRGRGQVMLHDTETGDDVVVFSEPDVFGGNLDISDDGRYAFYWTDAVNEFGTYDDHPRVYRYTVATGRSRLMPLPAAVAEGDEWRLLVLDSSSTGRSALTAWQVFPEPNVAGWTLMSFVTDTVARTHDNLGLDLTTTSGRNVTTAGSISGNGRFVTFNSTQAFVVGDNNETNDIYLLDRSSGDISLVNQRPNGRPGNNQVGSGFLGTTGRYVTFSSSATNLVPGLPDVFAMRAYQYDTRTDTMRLLTSDTDDGIAEAAVCGVSRTGRYTVLQSSSLNWGFPANPGGTSDRQVYRYDRTTDELALITHARRHDWPSNQPVYDGDCTISADGRHVSFSSFARDLIADPTLVDEYQTTDVFVWSAD